LERTIIGLRLLKAGWGYGSAGSTGINRPPVHTRWHNGLHHGDFLTESFCEKYWIPFLKGEEPFRADQAANLPLWIRSLARLPLRWFIAGILTLLVYVILYKMMLFPLNDFYYSFLPETIINRSVGLHLQHYGFDMKDDEIKFQMSKGIFDLDRYVDRSKVNDYFIILATRVESKEPDLSGVYNVTVADLPFDSTDMKAWKPADPAELAMFREECIRFAIFGIPKAALRDRPLGKTFMPNEYTGLKLFDTRTAGEHCS
jgi:hypothetical protein